MRFWFTENDPHVTEDNHGVWVKTTVSYAKRYFQDKMKPGDLVFIYETRYNRDHTVSDGHQKVVALVKISKLPFKPGKWVKVADISWLAAVACSEDDTKSIIQKASLRKIGQGYGGLNVMELSPAQAYRFVECCTSEVQRRKLIDEYFQTELEDPLEQSDIEKAAPTDYQKTPRKVEFIITKGDRQLKKNPGIAKRRILMANYKCEIDSSHVTFKSRVTGKNYVEAHHLIPLSTQDIIGDNSLDHEANIFSLCPNCHRLLHHAELKQKQAILRALFTKRKNELAKAGISLPFDQLTKYYA